MSKKLRTFVYIDASNLFYGGEKSLGWRIDYQKLFHYLKEKYEADKIYYFGGVEIYKYHYDYLKSETVPIEKLEKYLQSLIKNEGNTLNEAELLLLARHMQRVKFYKHLEQFGYDLYLKPVKHYTALDGSTSRKANCDVEMAFYLTKDRDEFDRVVILSGDGDFLPVLKYLKIKKKEVIVLARGNRTAREIRKFAGSNFRDFVRLERQLKFSKK